MKLKTISITSTEYDDCYNIVGDYYDELGYDDLVMLHHGGCQNIHAGGNCQNYVATWCKILGYNSEYAVVKMFFDDSIKGHFTYEIIRVYK